MKQNYMTKILFFAIFLSGLGTVWGQETIFEYTGSLQYYTVPADVTRISIRAEGAQGGNDGGLGAIMDGAFDVTPGDEFVILVGQQGGMALANQVGGGGGSFVSDLALVPFVVAGGGGGKAWDGSGSPTFPGIDANITTDGNRGYSDHGGSPTRYGIGGVDGNGSTLPGPSGMGHAGNGGGYYTSGAASSCGPPGIAYI